jgi:hypothetical protein
VGGHQSGVVLIPGLFAMFSSTHPLSDNGGLSKNWGQHSLYTFCTYVESKQSCVVAPTPVPVRYPCVLVPSSKTTVWSIFFVIVQLQVGPFIEAVPLQES